MKQNVVRKISYCGKFLILSAIFNFLSFLDSISTGGILYIPVSSEYIPWILLTITIYALFLGVLLIYVARKLIEIFPNTKFALAIKFYEISLSIFFILVVLLMIPHMYELVIYYSIVSLALFILLSFSFFLLAKEFLVIGRKKNIISLVAGSIILIICTVSLLVLSILYLTFIILNVYSYQMLQHIFLLILLLSALTSFSYGQGFTELADKLHD